MQKLELFFQVYKLDFDVKNKFLRKILELVVGIDKRVKLPLYNSETFTNYFKKNNNT